MRRARSFACVHDLASDHFQVLLRGPTVIGDGVISAEELRELAGETLRTGWYELTRGRPPRALFVGEELPATGG